MTIRLFHRLGNIDLPETGELRIPLHPFQTLASAVFYQFITRQELKDHWSMTQEQGDDVDRLFDLYDAITGANSLVIALKRAEFLRLVFHLLVGAERRMRPSYMDENIFWARLEAFVNAA